MATLREWFAYFTTKTGERVESVVLKWPRSPLDDGDDDDDRWPALPDGVTPFDSLPSDVLDHAFDDDYGCVDSPNLCAWSASWVVFSDKYDGREGLCWVPRSPVDHRPIRPGGG